MKDFDIFESYKSNIRYPLVAELKIINSEPTFTCDKYELFKNPHFSDGWKLMLPWKPRFVKLDYDFLLGIFFMNGILIEEHHLSLPPLNIEGLTFWWGHNHLQRLLKGLNVKFYGC
jgi:hypothetical protein